MNSEKITRRDFLRRSAGTAAVLGGISAGISACIPSTAPTIKADLRGNTILFDANIPELANVGDGVKLDNPALEYPILFIKKSDSSFLALSTECTHLGCQVRMQKNLLRCPCHGSVYDLDGNVLSGPAEKSLEVHPVRMNGTKAEISVWE